MARPPKRSLCGKAPAHALEEGKKERAKKKNDNRGKKKITIAMREISASTEWAVVRVCLWEMRASNGVELEGPRRDRREPDLLRRSMRAGSHMLPERA